MTNDTIPYGILFAVSITLAVIVVLLQLFDFVTDLKYTDRLHMDTIVRILLVPAALSFFTWILLVLWQFVLEGIS